MRTRAHTRTITKYCRQIGTKFLRSAFKRRVARGVYNHFSSPWFRQNNYYFAVVPKPASLSRMRIFFLGEIATVLRSLHDLEWMYGTIQWQDGKPAWLDLFPYTIPTNLRGRANWIITTNSVVSADILVQMCKTFDAAHELIPRQPIMLYNTYRLCRTWKFFKENILLKAVGTIAKFFQAVVCSRRTKNAAMKHNRFLLGLLLNKIDSKRERPVFSQDVKHCIAQFLL